MIIASLYVMISVSNKPVQDKNLLLNIVDLLSTCAEGQQPESDDYCQTVFEAESLVQ